MEPSVSGVGVLDKAVLVLGVLEARGPSSLAELVEASGLSRATAHRLAVALEVHGFVRRDVEGRFVLGTRLMALARAAASALPLADVAEPALLELRGETGESVQLYVREGDRRVCVAALESPHGLRTIVPLGASLPLGVGSAGRLLADPAAGSVAAPVGTESVSNRSRRARAGDSVVEPVGTESVPNRSRRAPDSVGEGDWVESVEEREAGVASVSAPIRDAEGAIVAAVSVSGPVERTSRHPGAKYGDAVVRAARRIERLGGFIE